VVPGRGRFVAVSGQVAVDEDGKVVGEGDAGAQARQVCENLRRCLAAAGATFDEVVQLTYFVTHMAHLPTASAVQVAALVRAEFLLEVEAFAVVDG
jgi:enamine deaminase RidA (YjgF/YER057c/UK114 family)